MSGQRALTDFIAELQLGHHRFPQLKLTLSKPGNKMAASGEVRDGEPAGQASKSCLTSALEVALFVAPSFRNYQHLYIDRNREAWVAGCM